MATHAERLKQALELRNLKQATLSALSGVSEASISHYLAGDYSPKTEKMQRMASALGVSVAWLGGYDSPVSESVGDGGDVGRLDEGHVVFHRNGKNVKVKLNEEQQRIFDVLVSSALREAESEAGGTPEKETAPPQKKKAPADGRAQKVSISRRGRARTHRK